MYSAGEPDPEQSDIAASTGEPPLIHLLPRLKEYLALVDPERVDRAMEFLINCESEEELFGDLQAQYGDLEVPVENNVKESTDVTVRSPRQTKASSSSASKPAPRPKAPTQPKKRSRTSVEEDDDEMSDFIVSDSEEEESSESEEESEFQESDLDEPEPDEDLQRRRRSPKGPAPAPVSQPPNSVPLGVPAGPTIVCKYGKACYRKNPVHFQEFAHPWLNPPS
jgi:hypothetical protein